MRIDTRGPITFITKREYFICLYEIYFQEFRAGIVPAYATYIQHIPIWDEYMKISSFSSGDFMWQLERGWF